MQEDGCGHFYRNSSKAGGVSVDQLQFSTYATVAVKTQAAMGCQQEYVCIKWGEKGQDTSIVWCFFSIWSKVDRFPSLPCL